MHLGPGLNINGGLITEAEHYLAGVAGTNLAQGRVLRAASHIYALRDQYPYQGQTITWAQAQAIARWTSRSMTAAQGLLNAHNAGEIFEGDVPQHMGMGPGYWLTAHYTINFTHGQQPRSLFFMMHFDHVPTAEDVEEAMEENASDYAFTYGIGAVQSLSGIIYTRAWRG